MIQSLLLAGGNIQTVSSLTDKESRKQWETIFNDHYIQPVLSTLDNNLAFAMDLIATDDQQSNCLFYI